ncbi:MAG: histidine kinase, partial [Longimicrobiales bacterium]|nr:histidine kinase [Longimicrobiales bacterium]
MPRSLATSAGSRSPFTRAADRALGLPLFWKLLWPSVVVSGGTVLFVLWLTHGEAFVLTPVSVALLLAGVTLGTGVVQAVLVRVALSPLARLEGTARRVGRGDFSARALPSRVEDAQMERLRVAFNRMLNEIEAVRMQKDRVAQETISAEEEERDTVARELWGEPAQALAGLLLRLRVLVRRHPEVSDAADEIEAGIRDALEEVRRLARRLRPPELDELGVRAALAAHLRSLTIPAAIEPAITGTVPDERLNPEGSLTLFRVLQSALTCAVSRDPDVAHPASITFREAGDRLVTEVHLPAGRGGQTGGHLPRLEGWAERIRWAGGEFVTREVARGDGARGDLELKLTLPLAAASPPPPPPPPP